MVIPLLIYIGAHKIKLVAIICWKNTYKRCRQKAADKER